MTGRWDVVVVGTGLSGLAAALRAAEGGARVLVLAKGIGATHLAPATIDVLGYGPGLVEHPGEALPAFAAERDGHPYGLLSVDDVARAIDWFKGRFAGGYGYRGDLRENLLLATPIGVPKPSAVVPETMAAGDVRAGGRPCFAGLRTLKDFFAPLLAENVSRARPEVRATAVELDLRAEGRVDSNALAFARAFDQPRFREEVAAALDGRIGDADRVGFPAVLGIADPHAAWEDLGRRLDRPVFEVPTLPPSVPGMRVYRALKAALARAGGRIVLNAAVVGAERSDGRLSAVRAQVAGRENGYAADWFVLATGGLASGAIALDSHGTARETVLGLPLARAPGPDDEHFRPEYFGPQPMARAGVAADARLRPVREDGTPAIENVLVVGATLAGALASREKSGDGISLATGHRAGELIVEEAA